MNIFNTNSVSKTAFSLFSLTLSAASLTTTQLVVAFGEENNETFLFENLPTDLREQTSVIKIITNRKGELINVFPGPLI